MAFDSSGTFSRMASGGGGGDGSGSALWQGDAAAGTKILASRHDYHDQDLANGLSQCLLRTGAGVPETDIPWGGKKIINLTNPTSPQDAATKDYVDNIPEWLTAKSIKGADLDGRLNFTGLSGVNGITWTYADVSWVARHSEASKTSSRLVMNNSITPNTTGDAVGDVFIIDDSGRINNDSGLLTSNLSFDGTSWRAITPGTGTRLTYTGGALALASNDVATITNNYAVATLRDIFKVQNASGSAYLDLTKQDGTINKATILRSYAGVTPTLRWQMQLGDGTVAESGTRVGSDFRLQSYANDGTTAINEIVINRNTHLMTIAGAFTAAGAVTSTQQFNSSTTTATLSAAAGGRVYLRPDGPGSATGQVYADTTDGLQCSKDVTAGTAADNTFGTYAGAGVRGKSGNAGSYTAHWHNSVWNGSALTLYANASNLGQVTFACDYRIKKDIQPLPSTWERVKALNPIRYTQRAFDIWTEESDVRWGFIAHELQEQLDPSAATGKKDGPEVQSPNLMAVIAGLTRALQEAMTRIEALEAAA